MQSLFEFLASAPKSHLAKLHRRDHPEAGLQPSAKIVEEVQSKALDSNRLQIFLKSLEHEGRRLLLAIYAAEERGMLESELIRGCDNPSTAAFLLSTLEFELLAFCREGENRSFHGFRELAEPILKSLLDEFSPLEASTSTAWMTNSVQLTSHFCHFLARAAKGELRLTQAGEFHRKSLQDLAGAFTSSSPLSSAVSTEEAILLFRFAVDAGLLLEHDGVLKLSPTAGVWLEEGRDEVTRRLQTWWRHQRVGGSSHSLNLLASSETDAKPARVVSTLAAIFSAYQGWEKAKLKSITDTENTWENLPKLLRELWILGGVDFSMHKGRIRYARFRIATATPSLESPRGLPNLEALVPVGCSLKRQFQIELVSQRINDEVLTQFRFTKESVVEGLRSGMMADGLQELVAWLGFEHSARRTFSDWAAAYVSTVFREILVLRVRDGERFRELESFPQFMELVTETIPGYGFVMPKLAKERARELLRIFDLLPGEEISVDAHPVSHLPVPDPADPQWCLPRFVHGEIVYRHTTPVRRELPGILESERGGRVKAEQTVQERMQSLEGAIRLQKTVEFSYNGAIGKRIQVQPLHVLRNRDPIKLIAVEVGSGHRNEYRLDQVQGLRILEPG